LVLLRLMLPIIRRTLKILDGVGCAGSFGQSSARSAEANNGFFKVAT